MIRGKLVRSLQFRPFLVDILKRVFSHPFLVNNTLYQKVILQKARQFARAHPDGIMGVSLETTVLCNSKCVMCNHRYHDMRGVMGMELFKKIVADCLDNHILRIGLSVYGEPFMDPHLFERILYLRDFQIEYGLSTNGSLLDMSCAEKLFRIGGLRRINFSVCGYSPEVYESVMQGLQRDVVYENIRNFLLLKERYHRTDIDVVISTVKLHANQHERKEFIRFWQKQPGVNSIITADLWDRVGDQGIDEIGSLGNMHRRNNWLAPCKQLWGAANVYFDGRVAPCCDDADTRELIVGDLNKESLRQVYAGIQFRQLRALHLDNKRRLHPLCGKCYHSCAWI
ncbi:MAG TPA: SPASM domain-containing protein [Candidatus Omnitrophota bacterium]|nr:SPASM domain-containing protein [Candidatus Omnitrophota bacterium]HPT07018.1 SPASM domain-containing protein [Candidatus Omnitrophota bacterium]